MVNDAEWIQPDLSPLEGMLRYEFRDGNLLLTALTHSSWANENGSPLHNERLEFLGDAVLEINISQGLYERFPDEREGSMTRMRSRLVGEAKLAELALSLGIGEFLRLGRGEEAQGGRGRPALLADAFEAVLGAIYLDGGHEKAAALVKRLYEGQWPNPGSVRKGKDFKTNLQEVTQARFKALPVYMPLGSSGPEHAKQFQVRLELPQGPDFTGSASSLKRAEQEAARQALDFLTRNDSRGSE